MRDPKVMVITGGSGGLGAALARHYAGAGRVLHLTGRNATALEAVAADVRAAGATVLPHQVDVTDGPAMAALMQRIDDDTPVDLVIANAGISAGTGRAGLGESPDQTRRLFATNVDGVLNTVLPVMARMAERGRGQIALMSSLAGYRGVPGAPAYCGSKAAVKVYGESLRGVLAPHGVGVSVICPGYVRTAMTAKNDFPMPFLMDADRAAAIIARCLALNRSRISFPWPMAALVWLLAALPPAVVEPLLNRLPRKRGLAEDA